MHNRGHHGGTAGLSTNHSWMYSNRPWIIRAAAPTRKLPRQANHEKLDTSGGLDVLGRRNAAERVMGSLLVVVDEPPMGDLADFVEGREQV